MIIKHTFLKRYIYLVIACMHTILVLHSHWEVGSLWTALNIALWLILFPRCLECVPKNVK
jgi:hypothetical protein